MDMWIDMRIAMSVDMGAGVGCAHVQAAHEHADRRVGWACGWTWMQTRVRGIHADVRAGMHQKSCAWEACLGLDGCPCARVYGPREAVFVKKKRSTGR